MRDGTDVILEVAEMRARLEVVATAIRDNAAVGNMNLANTPPVEPGLVEEVAEDVIRAYLDVTRAGTKSADAVSAGY